MSSYSLTLKSSAAKELNALSDELFGRIDPRIRALATVPRPAGCAKLSGYKDQWRIRVGDYRVIYTIDEASRRVTVVRVAHRREVYAP